jgi:hypothetical protein
MEQYLRQFVSYQQDDWANWLPMAEFVANNSRNETTGTSPFLANSGQHPRMGFEPPTVSQRQPTLVNVDTFVSNMDELNQFLREEMAWAQAIYSDKADRNRQIAPNYLVGDQVWLNLKNMRSRRPTKKLDWKNAGPYEIIAKVSPYAFRLRLPDSIRIWPVINVSNLMPTADYEPLPGQRQEPPPPIEIDGEQEYAVERILSARVFRRRLQFLVKWRGYDNPDDDTWEPEEIVQDTSALEEYETQNTALIQRLRDDIRNKRAGRQKLR